MKVGNIYFGLTPDDYRPTPNPVRHTYDYIISFTEDEHKTLIALSHKVKVSSGTGKAIKPYDIKGVVREIVIHGTRRIMANIFTVRVRKGKEPVMASDPTEAEKIMFTDYESESCKNRFDSYLKKYRS